MRWVKRTDTQEGSKFWSHVHTVAERVRTSEIYTNNRMPKVPAGNPFTRHSLGEKPPNLTIDGK
jgi:hypothetical protein